MLPEKLNKNISFHDLNLSQSSVKDKHNNIHGNLYSMMDKNIKILLVDDDEGDYLIVRTMLDGIEGFSFQLDWVDSSADGLSTFLEVSHDVYLIDYRLGPDSGLDLLRGLISRGCRKPIVMMSGEANYQVDVEAMNCGAFDYLVKGEIDSTGLERAIRYAMARNKIEISLSDSEEEYRTILNNIDEYIYVRELPCEEFPCGRISFVSGRLSDITGYKDIDTFNNQASLRKVIHPSDFDRAIEAIKIAFKMEPGEIKSVDYRIISKNSNNYIWIEEKIVPKFDDVGVMQKCIGVVRDATERKKVEQQLLHDALHDQLTGLPNRTLFMDRLRGAMNRAKRKPTYQFAVLFIDLDRFKNINDVMGHLCGDKLLISMSERLISFMRPGDTVSRLGGDEFAVLLEEIAYAYDATFVADRIQDLLSIPTVIDGHEVFSTASIGIALNTTGYDNPEDMLRDADTAMYKAKAEGRARHEVFDKDMHANAASILQLETDLRKALERNEFTVHYQPIVDLTNGKIVSFEALIRWQHTEKGLISPLDFIPLAEETGLIVQIGQWILRESCLQMQEWKQTYPENALSSVSVNLSARQFSDIHLVEHIDQVITESGLSPSNLKLEITESVVMENQECIQAVLSQFKSMGIKLSMDDFGTGYSSLSYLHRLPINTLKIDRSFIGRIHANSGPSEIVNTIITLAQNLNLDVVAEGIETAEQLDVLKQLECAHGQGYYFSKPLTAEDASKLLAENLIYSL